MGGSAGPGSPHKPGKRGKKDPCDLNFKTTLFSPVASVVGTLSVGDELDIILHTQNHVMSIVAMTQSSAQIAGTITGAQQLGNLISCLQNGVVYVADVNQISGAIISLTIRQA